MTPKITLFNALCIGICIALANKVIYSNSQFHGQSLKFKLSATSLPNCDFDFDGTSDPYAILFTSVQSGEHRHWEKFGQTSAKKDTLNPEWDEVFVYQYINGTNQTWRIFVIDKDQSWYNPFDDPLGRVDVAVDDYIREIRNTRDNETSYRPVQLFLTRPIGGALTVTPVND